MAFRVNDPQTRINGTSLQGHLDITFQELFLTLGEPKTTNDKSLAHWTILGSIKGNWVVATIYDNRTNRDVERITDWNIGGYDQKALELVRRAIDLANIKPLRK
jgi:hypothetical protein